MARSVSYPPVGPREQLAFQSRKSSFFIARPALSWETCQIQTKRAHRPHDASAAAQQLKVYVEREMDPLFTPSIVDDFWDDSDQERENRLAVATGAAGGARPKQQPNVHLRQRIVYMKKHGSTKTHSEAEPLEVQLRFRHRCPAGGLEHLVNKMKCFVLREDMKPMFIQIPETNGTYCCQDDLLGEQPQASSGGVTCLGAQQRYCSYNQRLLVDSAPPHQRAYTPFSVLETDVGATFVFDCLTVMGEQKH